MTECIEIATGGGDCPELDTVTGIANMKMGSNPLQRK